VRIRFNVSGVLALNNPPQRRIGRRRRRGRLRFDVVQ